jgi:soluble lytic murein transglycosylase-like protein
MRYSASGAAAVLAICLSGLQTISVAQATVINDANDARAFAVREGELARERAAGKSDEAAAAAVDANAEKAAESVSTKPARTAKRAGRTPLAAPAASDGLKAIVARHAAANGVPFALADAVVRIESRYNPRAANAGNYGLMQIRHQTARGMGYSGSASGLLDADTNARYAMKYLAQAYRLAGGDTCRTVMKYQSGHMAVRMSGANRTYCAKVRTITASN